MANADQWCFCWLADNPHAVGAEKGALVKGAKWVPGDTITISFLDGDARVQERVKNAALKWRKYANVVFSFYDTTDTDIRISFREKGSWSMLGTTCRKETDHARPTMNFGWLKPGVDDEELNRVVLHEFGHALGLAHEHANPSGEIRWKRKTVIEELKGPPHYWDEKKIEANIFQTCAVGETNFSEFDAKSIMVYPIPARWTEDGFSTELNKNLSATDIDFIRSEYP